MGDASKIVPPQLQRKRIFRRVWAYRLVRTAGACYFALAVVLLLEWETVMLGHSGIQFWIATTLASFGFLCTLLVIFFYFTEKPKQVEVVDNPLLGANVKHVVAKE
ncbi:MAG: hypothetical protein OEY77_10535 [Nitrospira sp.]|nr:hypothetical protein [Nitrospira sp.]